MNKERDRELESSETWDYERPGVRRPVKASRVVVSVAFRHEDFARVAQHAERLQEKVSEFIREAALERATGQGGGNLVYGSGGTGTLWWLEHMPPITQVTGFAKELSISSEQALFTRETV